VGNKPRWSDRRRRTLIGLGLGIVAFGLGGIALPDQYGVSSAFLAGLCAFLLLVAVVVFVAMPGPGTFDFLLRTSRWRAPCSWSPSCCCSPRPRTSVGCGR
jgi:peptidoglycan/LPS O-acetylase OafA/YrhL